LTPTVLRHGALNLRFGRRLNVDSPVLFGRWLLSGLSAFETDVNPEFIGEGNDPKAQHNLFGLKISYNTTPKLQL